jgi:hypothetical protein
MMKLAEASEGKTSLEMQPSGAFLSACLAHGPAAADEPVPAFTLLSGGWGVLTPT